MEPVVLQVPPELVRWLPGEPSLQDFVEPVRKMVQAIETDRACGGDDEKSDDQFSAANPSILSPKSA